MRFLNSVTNPKRNINKTTVLGAQRILTGFKFRNVHIKSHIRSSKPGAKHSGLIATKHCPRFAGREPSAHLLTFGP